MGFLAHRVGEIAHVACAAVRSLGNPHFSSFVIEITHFPNG
jgi:hypothetical protein